MMKLPKDKTITTLNFKTNTKNVLSNCGLTVDLTFSSTTVFTWKKIT